VAAAVGWWRAGLKGGWVAGLGRRGERKWFSDGGVMGLLEIVDEGDGVVSVMKMMRVMLLVWEMEMIRAIFTMLEP